MDYPIKIYLSCCYIFAKNAKTAMHAHENAYQLFYCISGESERTCCDNKVILSPGQFMLACPNMPHDMTCTETGKVLDIKFNVFDDKLAGELKQIAGRAITCQEENPLFLQIAEAVGNPDRNMLRLQELYLETAFYVFFNNRTDVKKACEPKETTKNSQIKEIIEKSIIPFIDGFIILPVEKFNAKNIINGSGYNRQYFGRKFEEVVGMSFTHYYHERRLSIAKDFLKNTDLPIREIAALLDYNDVAYFSKYFKAKTGLLPKTYRAQSENFTEDIQKKDRPQDEPQH